MWKKQSILKSSSMGLQTNEQYKKMMVKVGIYMASILFYTAACVALLILWATSAYIIYRRGFAAGVAYVITVVMDKYELKIPMLTLNEKLGIELKE